MKPRLPKSVLLPLAAGLVQILSGCLSSTSIDPDRSAGGSDEIDTRIAVDRTGRPVAGARIALVRADDSTGKPVALSATGKDGTFPNFAVADGFYSVLLRDPGDSLGRFVDSVHVVSRKLPSGRDTLLSLGSVRGVVRMATGDSPTSVDIGLLGTDIVTAPKTDGTFKIELVPGGLYTLGAVTGLGGYGRLYKRIQVADGQNLVLPDTLVLPFTGLPIPAGLRVLQDATTGNVQVTWSRVVHPDLLGYVLERVDGGATTFSRYLTDTSWTDSLGAYWEAMPLYGPWPSRDVAYRVRSRSLSGAMDTKSMALAITAKPPEWTKQVDPISCSLSTFDKSRHANLKWSVPQQPDLFGWSIVRVVDGKVDCKQPVSTGKWSDSTCSESAGLTFDSTTNLSPSIHLVRQVHSRVEYQLWTLRALGRSELAWDTLVTTGSGTLVDWRDSSLTGIDSSARFQSKGGWILKSAAGNQRSISKDGIVWEPIPDSFRTWVGMGDSVWCVKLATDSIHVEIGSRGDEDGWNTRLVPLPTKAGRLGELSVQGGELIITYGVRLGGYGYFRDTILQLEGSQLRPSSLAGLGSLLEDFQAVTSYPAEAGDLRIDEIYDPAFPKACIVSHGQVVSQRSLSWGQHWSRVIGAYGLDGALISTYSDSFFVYIPPSGNALAIATPPAVQSDAGSSIAEATVFRDEIWMIRNGHLWKGKLNLPKLEKP